MSLIDKQAAIDAVISVIPYDEYWKEQIEKAVNALPSAQPESSQSVVNASQSVVNDCISRKAAIDALDALCDRECIYSKKQRSVMCGACHLGSAFDVIEQLPSAQPTLYGYNIEHLELIARVLQKEDLSPERVVEMLIDIGRIVAIVKDEFEEALRKAVEQCTI